MLTRASPDDHRSYHSDDPSNHNLDHREKLWKGKLRRHRILRNGRQASNEDDQSEPMPSHMHGALSDDMHNLSLRLRVKERSIVCREPVQRIFRSMTAPSFSEGKVFHVDPTMERPAEYAAMAGRSILVIGNHGSSVVCLTLGRHTDVYGGDQEFLRARVRLYTKPHGNPDERWAPEHFKQCPCPPLALEPRDGRMLFRDVWINLAEPQTIKNVQGLAVVWQGALNEDDFSKLKGAYIATQARMLNAWQSKPNTFIYHLLLFWCFTRVFVGGLFCRSR